MRASIPLRRYGFAILVTGAALLIQLALHPYIRATPFILFFGAVMLAGWKGGGGPGLLSTGLSALLADYFFLPPQNSFATSPREFLSVFLFLLMGTLITRLNVQTRRSRAEAENRQHELERSEARLRLATEVAGVGVWELDFATRKIWRNELHDRAFGYTAPVPEWSLDTFFQHVHPEDRERVEREVLRAQESLGAFELEFRVTWPDGSPHWMAARGRVQRDATDRPTHFVGTCVNITARRQAERDLERAVHLRDEFLSAASHELKTPLTSLNLKLQALARAVRAEPDSLRPEHCLRDLEVMIRQVRRLSDLVNDLLDVSRISTGRMKSHLEPVDLTEVVREVASRLEPEAKRSRCPVLLDVEGPLVGQWDRFQLEQVVEKLLSNAIKYGAGKPIHLGARRNEAQARLVVQDEGIGISPEALGRIFGRFERAVSERHYGGLGLGLYITWQIVSALGGEIQVQSHPGRGATFTVDLPLNGGTGERDPD